LQPRDPDSRTRIPAASWLRVLPGFLDRTKTIRHIAPLAAYATVQNSPQRTF